MAVKNYYAQLEEVSDSEFVKNYIATTPAVDGSNLLALIPMLLIMFI